MVKKDGTELREVHHEWFHSTTANSSQERTEEEGRVHGGKKRVGEERGMVEEEGVSLGEERERMGNEGGRV